MHTILENALDDKIKAVTGLLVQKITKMELLDIIIVAIGVFGTLNNGILLFIFLINPLKTFSSTSTYFIKCLTVADFVTSLMTIIWGFEIIPSESFLRAYFFIFWMSVQVSFYLIFLMSIERYIAVHYPLKKQVIVTKGRTLTCIAVVCSVSAVLAGISEIKTIRKYVRFSLFTLFDVIVICIVTVYIKIVVTLKKISNEARSNLFNRTSRLRSNKIKQDRQLLIVVFAMLTILAVTVLPYTIASQVYLVDRLFFVDWTVDKGILRKLVTYYFPVEVINFAVNPIIYAIRLPNYRKSLMALVCFNRREMSHQEVTKEWRIFFSNFSTLLCVVCKSCIIREIWSSEITWYKRRKAPHDFRQGFHWPVYFVNGFSLKYALIKDKVIKMCDSVLLFLWHHHLNIFESKFIEAMYCDHEIFYDVNRPLSRYFTFRISWKFRF